jgi:hypothetical protein
MLSLKAAQRFNGHARGSGLKRDVTSSAPNVRAMVYFDGNLPNPRPKHQKSTQLSGTFRERVETWLKPRGRDLRMYLVDHIHRA